MIEVVINNKTHLVDVKPDTPLLWVIRDILNFTGTKYGCGIQQCGACTVLVNGRRINSCLTLAVMHQDDEIVTIEGLASGDALHPMPVSYTHLTLPTIYSV